MLGLRQRWQQDHPAAGKLTLMAGFVTFDERGMHLHALAEETEAGKAQEFVKVFGRSLGELSRTVLDQRLEKIGKLVADLDAKGATGKRFVHLQAMVRTGLLEDWFAPFERAK